MPITYQIDEREGVVTTSVFGHVTATDVRRYLEAIQRDAEYASCSCSFVDVDDSVELLIDSQSIQGIAISEIVGPRITRAAIYAPNDVTYGLSRLFQGFRSASSDIDVRVFRERSEALAFAATDGL
jgi:hypothetical protein